MILLTAREAAEMVQRKPATIRSWAHRRHLAAVRHDPRTGAALYRRRDLWLAEKAARARDHRRVSNPAVDAGGATPSTCRLSDTRPRTPEV